MLCHMKTYPAAHWVELGEWIASARLQAGHSDTAKWAALVGRSTRITLGLERGEPAGAKTVEAVADALRVPNWLLFSILDTGESDVSWTEARIKQAQESYEFETGLEADGAGEPSLLGLLSDDELIAELARRLATRPLSRAELKMQQALAPKGGDGNADTDTGGSASTNPGVIAMDDASDLLSGEGDKESGEPRRPGRQG